ncbi:hypothetical protein K443DRAFT_676942 [Laccaria amethystina LaAM-08-1]|uniref:FAD-binding domain-containing protein n=1 Tax=Laccaria amethystina LaAM-08-1 TaxID=1095629 RepID=A0A0C9XP27_9AGAR|nr:hypothetical protein K443DRAFT_676942 [Laccaria amethystina LaAM-08-1]
MSTCSSPAGCDGMDTLSNSKNTRTELANGGNTTDPFCFNPLVLPPPGVRTTATQMPVQVVPSGRCKAAVCLKFIVVGGSIGGLATAYALRKMGHDVLVIEESEALVKSQGGLRSPPNMTRILNQWGLGPALDQMANRCDTFTLLNGGSGELIGNMMMNESFLSNLLAEFLFIQHSDLQSLLYDLAVKEGVTFRFNTKVIGADSETVSVSLEGGETLSADVVVGADGYDSLVRGVVTGKKDEGKGEKHLIMTYTIPASLLEADDELRHLRSSTVWSLWLGEGYVFHGNFTAGGQDFTMAVIHHYDLPTREGDEEWQHTCPIDRYKLDINKFEPRCQKLLKLAQTVSSRIFTIRSPVEGMVCERARIVLVGEAAHPLPPGGHHSTGLSIEDAQTLGCLFGRIRHRSQVPQLLGAYEDIRQARCSATHIWEREHQQMLMCPAGPHQDERDKMLRKVLAYGDWQQMDETTFKAVWGNELTLYSHDATEQVDDWWSQWGKIFERGVCCDEVDTPANLEVSISKNDERELL